MNVIEIQPNKKENIKNGNLVIAQSGGDSVYPIGSLYLTLDKSDICPLEKLGFGKWELVPSNLCLQSAPTAEQAGETVDAGLPNVKGRFYTYENIMWNETSSSAIYTSGAWGNKAYHNWGPSNTPKYIEIDASKSNKVYGRSDTVQPPALYVNVWKRVA